MADPDQRQGNSQKAPSYEALKEAEQFVNLSPDALRLYWNLDGPLSSAIWIMESKFYDPSTTMEPYFLSISEDGTLNWSAISQSPLTTPRISSVTVHVNELDWWEESWLELHHNHGDNPDLLLDSDEEGEGEGKDADAGQNCATTHDTLDRPDSGNHDDDDGIGEAERRWGPLPDYDPDSDEEGPTHLLRCCNGDRPRKTKVSLVVNATGDFLTIHDYVSVVHPWLVGMRQNLLRAAGNLLDNEPLPADTKLVVSCLGPNDIMVMEDAEWRKDNIITPTRLLMD